MFLQPVAPSGCTFCVRKLSRLQNRATGCILRLHLFFHRLLNLDICEWLLQCNRQWARAWRQRAAMSCDETIVPHVGKRIGRLRQFVPTKPHSTGLKLYVLADAYRSYATDTCL